MGNVIAYRRIRTTKGTRTFHLTSDLQSKNLYHLYGLFDITLEKPEEGYLSIWR
jgi:hypothetical protein